MDGPKQLIYGLRGVSRRDRTHIFLYAQRHLTREHGLNLFEADLILTEVYNHEVLTFKDLNHSAPLDGIERILVFKCADCGHFVETASGHYRHAKKSGHDRKTHKVRAQRVFPKRYLEVEHAQEIPTSQRFDRFEQLYPEEPIDDIVHPMGVGMDDELLRRAGWSTLMEGNVSWRRVEAAGEAGTRW